MKQRIFALIAILTGAAAGTAVTAVNFHLSRKTKESEKEGRQNFHTAGEFYERADLAQEQSFLLQRDIANFAMLSDVDKEKVMAFARKLARGEKDGPDIPAAKQTGDEIADRKTADEGESATLQSKSEDEKEKEKLMAEYWRRAKNVYGHGDLAYGFAKNAKPVYHCNTSCAYISVADAAKKTGRPASYIRECCNIPDLMGKEFFSAGKNGGGVFRYMSQTEYAEIPEDRIEVDTREQKTEEEKDDDITLTATPQEITESESVTPQAKREEEKERLVAEYLRRVENAYGHSKELRVWAPYARPIRNSRTGYAYISITDASKKTGCSARDIYHSCVSNNWQGDEWCYISKTEYAKMPEERIEVETKDQKTEEEKDDNDFVDESGFHDDTTPVTPEAANADKDEEERLMAEYWRRAEKVYGRDNRAHGWAKTAKPVRNSRTGYAYISIQNAAKKTDSYANYIHQSCVSNDPKDGEWHHITKVEYAKLPEEMTEVKTKDQRTEATK